jgi:hypothetical protein
MTITEYHIVVGKMIPTHELYMNVFENDKNFRRDMKECFKSQTRTGVVWDDFYDFIKSGTWGENMFDSLTTEQHDDMIGFYNDTSLELSNYEWTAKNRTKLQIVHFTHDVNEDMPHVVGKTIQTFDHDEIPEISIEQANDAKKDLEIITGWTDVKAYIVQNDCGCCT